MIVGIGNDITDCGRIETVLRKHGDHFLEHLLTPREQAEGGGRLSYCAGRWAAKEAIAKALGCGIGEHCAFTDMEILNNPDGRPEAVLSGEAERTAKKRRAERIHLTISHERKYAIATAVLETL